LQLFQENARRYRNDDLSIGPLPCQMLFYQCLHYPGFHGDYHDVGRSQRAVVARNGLQFRIELLYFGGFARAAVDDRNVLWSEQVAGG
jgi:hypothetical protein